VYGETKIISKIKYDIKKETEKQKATPMVRRRGY